MLFELKLGAARKPHPNFSHQACIRLLHVADGGKHILAQFRQEIHFGFPQHFVMGGRHIFKSLVNNFLACFPVFLLCNNLEHGCVEQSQEVRVTVFLNSEQVRMHFAHWLDKQFAVVRRIKNAQH
jgi:hypothetical protein